MDLPIISSGVEMAAGVRGLNLLICQPQVVLCIDSPLSNPFEPLLKWKEGMEKEGLRLNARETKIMWCQMSKG